MKVRVSTTVDEQLLAAARAAGDHPTDASLLEAALTAYLETHRKAETDAAYTRAYAAHGVDEPDAWGDLASWHRVMDRV